MKNTRTMSINAENYACESEAKEEGQAMAEKYRAIVEIWGYRKGRPAIIKRCYPPVR